MTVPEPIIELAPAKINLTLRILGRRPDGYHELESLVVFADVADVITLTPGRQPGVTVSGPFAGAIAGENLGARALGLFADAMPGAVTGWVHIEKHLPVAAGIGGGSADGAAVLRALARANTGRGGLPDIMALAAKLGADVPACVVSRPLIMRGIGERTEMIDTPVFHAVLVTPRIDVPANKTAAVFKALAAPRLGSLSLLKSAHAQSAASPSPRSSRGEGRSEGPPRVADFTESIEVLAACHPDPLPAEERGEGISWLQWLATRGNDLEPAAASVMPGLTSALGALAAQPGATCVRLSGAGPTGFALFAEEAAAKCAANVLAATHPDWWVVATRLG